MAYIIDEIEYPSVTTILGLLDKPALKQWAANCAVDYIEENLEVITHPKDQHSIDDLLKAAKYAYTTESKKALSTGTIVHDMIEAYIKSEAFDDENISDQAQNSFLAFLDWEDLNRVEWLESELTVCNPEIGYAGTLDAIAIINGHKYLVDFKTSKSVYPEYKTQLSAYLAAYNLTHDDKVKKIAILRLDKETGEPEFKDLTKGHEKSYTAFCKLADYYYAAAKRKLKNNQFVRWYHG